MHDSSIVSTLSATLHRMLPHTGALRHLFWTAIKHSIPSTCIQLINLETVYIYAEMTPHESVAILKCCVSAGRVTLKGIHDYFQRAVTTTVIPTLLENLLHLALDYDRTLEVLPYFTLPALRSLRIETRLGVKASETHTKFTSLLSFLARSDCRLQSLEIIDLHPD